MKVRKLQVHRTIILIISICFIDLPANANYSGGDGTPENPYQIATIEDLMLLGDNPEDYDKHFIMTADIDLDPNLPGRRVFDKAVIAPDIDPNDTYSPFQGTKFSGVFDGNGFTISGLTISGTSDLALFGRLDFSAIVNNLGLIKVNVNGTGYSVGGLVGFNEGSIAKSYCTGIVIGNSHVGGLVGENYGSIDSSYSSGTVIGEWDVGGLVGFNYYGSIVGVVINGSHKSFNLYGSINSSYSNSVVTGKSNIGGLVGNNSGIIDSSNSSGTVDGEWSIGGLVGYNYYGSIVDGDINGNPVNLHFYGSINSSYSNSVVIGDTDVGGLVGYNEGSHITSSYSTGMISGNDYVGGLVGGDQMGSIFSSYNTGTVSGNTKVGGIVGEIQGGNIVWSNSTGSVSGTGSEIGGLVGSNYWGLITTSYSTGSVSGGDFVGGLVGENNGSGRIASSYSTSSVSGITDVGGLVGINSRHSYIDSSYSSGTVSGTYDVGGLVGRNNLVDLDEEDRISSSFWDIETSGQTTSACGIGKATTEMRDPNTFMEAGWDFETVWMMSQGNYPHPERRKAEATDSNGWIRLSPMKMARDQFTGCIIGDEIFVFGGNAMGGRDLYSGEKYNIATNTWSNIADNPNYEHPHELWLGLGVEELSGIGFNGKFYVFGAQGGLNYNEMYDPVTNTWTTLAKKPTTTVTAIPIVYKGKIYLFGGSASDEDSDGRIYYDIVEAYDPENDEWEEITKIPKRLTPGKAVTVHNNYAYIIGGYDVDGEERNDEVMAYDFEADDWIRNYHTLPPEAVWWYSYATQAPVVNGKVYLIGGAGGEYPKNYWISDKFTIFDIEAKDWESGPALPAPRDGPLTVVSNNSIYVIGGADDLDNHKDTVFAYTLPDSP